MTEGNEGKLTVRHFCGIESLKRRKLCSETEATASKGVLKVAQCSLPRPQMSDIEGDLDYIARRGESGFLL